MAFTASTKSFTLKTEHSRERSFVAYMAGGGVFLDRMLTHERIEETLILSET